MKNSIREVVIVSGKGGTGKTSITAAFAALSSNAVFADCDVDAADLHLILDPEVIEETDFLSGNLAYIRKEQCTACGICESVCRFDALETVLNSIGELKYRVIDYACEGCGLCVRLCPEAAIDFPKQLCGKLYVSNTRFGKWTCKTCPCSRKFR